MENTATYNGIIEIKIEILDAINRINASKLKLNNLFTVMQSGGYSANDIAEMEAIITEVNGYLSEL